VSKKKKEAARMIHFHGGPCDALRLRMALVLPDVLAMDMGRAWYAVDRARPNHYHYVEETRNATN